MKCMICGKIKEDVDYTAWPFMPPTANWKCCGDCFESEEKQRAKAILNKYERTRWARVGDEIIIVYLPDKSPDLPVFWRRNVPFDEYFLKTGVVTEIDEYKIMKGTWGDYALFEPGGDLLGHIKEI